MNKQLSILAAAVAMSMSASAGAVTLVDWNLEGTPGTQASQAANSAAANITGGSITRGAGIDTGGTTCTNCFYSRGWDSTESGYTAASPDYFSFGFSVASGYEVDLATLEIGTRSSGSGPGTLGLYYSGDGYSSVLYTFNQAGTPSGTGYLNLSIDLSTLPNITGAVDFRIYEIGNLQADGVGATASTGTFRLTNFYVASLNDHNMAFTGTVSAPVPEADTYAFMALGMGLVGLLARRRKV